MIFEGVVVSLDLIGASSFFGGIFTMGIGIEVLSVGDIPPIIKKKKKKKKMS